VRRTTFAGLRLLLLGSINLTRFVTAPSRRGPRSITKRSRRGRGLRRMLDNRARVTAWPLEAQHREAMAKRRVGWAFTASATRLLCCGCGYDSEERVRRRRRSPRSWITLTGPRASWRRSAARSRFSTPTVSRGSGFAARLPRELKGACPQAGHPATHTSLSLAPTGINQPRVCRQRLDGIDHPSPGLHAKSAWRRDAEGIPGRGYAWRLSSTTEGT